MDTFTAMAGQLQTHAYVPPPPKPKSDNKAERLRQELRDNGPQTARELAAATGLPHSGMVSALLKQDRSMRRVLLSVGYYSWNLEVEERPRTRRGPARVRDVLDWHEVAEDDSPDADLTVIVRLRNNEEPVWIGFFDGEEWRDADGQPVEVVRWAEMPAGGEV